MDHELSLWLGPWHMRKLILLQGSALFFRLRGRAVLKATYRSDQDPVIESIRMMMPTLL